MDELVGREIQTYECKVVERPVGSAENVFDVTTFFQESHRFAESHFANDVPRDLSMVSVSSIFKTGCYRFRTV